GGSGDESPALAVVPVRRVLRSGAAEEPAPWAAPVGGMLSSVRRTVVLSRRTLASARYHGVPVVGKVLTSARPGGRCGRRALVVTGVPVRRPRRPGGCRCRR